MEPKIPERPPKRITVKHLELLEEALTLSKFEESRFSDVSRKLRNITVALLRHFAHDETDILWTTETYQRLTERKGLILKYISEYRKYLIDPTTSYQPRIGNLTVLEFKFMIELLLSEWLIEIMPKNSSRINVMRKIAKKKLHVRKIYPDLPI